MVGETSVGYEKAGDVSSRTSQAEREKTRPAAYVQHQHRRRERDTGRCGGLGYDQGRTCYGYRYSAGNMDGTSKRVLTRIPENLWQLVHQRPLKRRSITTRQHSPSRKSNVTNGRGMFASLSALRIPAVFIQVMICTPSSPKTRRKVNRHSVDAVKTMRVRHSKYPMSQQQDDRTTHGV